MSVEPNYAHIVVALDGSENAELVLPHVVALAARCASRVTLVQATDSMATVPLADVDPTPIVDREHAAASAYLTGVAGRLRRRGIDVSTDEPEGPPAEAIAASARRLDAGLIALTTHGRSGLAHMVFGSVAESLLREAPCPVLLVRVR